MVTAVASDTNPDYKSSEATYVDVLTEKDPNGPIAEYMASELKWDNAGYFVFVTDHYEIFRVKMNDSDCPDHKTINEGNYTAVASSTVPAGKFSVYQKVIGGSSEGWTSTKTTSTMSVKYVDGEYVIVVNYIGAWGGNGEVGYKGVPDGWVVPGEGGDEPVDPTPTPDPEPDQPTPDPDQPVEDFTNWVFDAHYNTSNRVVTLSGRNDERVITLVTDELAFSKFYADSENYGDYFTNLTVDGVPTDDVTPTSYVQIKSSGVVINLVINGVTYTGTSKSFSY